MRYKMNVQYLYTNFKTPLRRKEKRAHTAAPPIVYECRGLFTVRIQHRNKNKRMVERHWQEVLDVAHFQRAVLNDVKFSNRWKKI